MYLIENANPDRLNPEHGLCAASLLCAAENLYEGKIIYAVWHAAKANEYAKRALLESKAGDDSSGIQLVTLKWLMHKVRETTSNLVDNLNDKMVVEEKKGKELPIL